MLLCSASITAVAVATLDLNETQSDGGDDCDRDLMSDSPWNQAGTVEGFVRFHLATGR